MKCRLLWISLISLMFLTVPALAAEEQAKQAPASPPAETHEAATKAATTTAEEKEPSIAEQIVYLEEQIAKNEKAVQELQGKISNEDSEYAQAKKAFQENDDERKAKGEELDTLKEAGQEESARAKELQEEITEIEERWKLARERFDLAIEQNKAIQMEIKALNEKLDAERKAMAKLIAATQPATKPAEAPTDTAPAPTPAAQEKPVEPAPSVPAVPGLPGMGTTGTEQPAEKKEEPLDEELVEALKKVEEKTTEVQDVAENVEILEKHIAATTEQIDTIKQLLINARKRVDNAQQAVDAYTQDIRKRSSEGAPREELNELWRNREDARQRAQEARGEVTQYQDQIEELNQQRTRYQERLHDELQKKLLKEKELKEAEAQQEEYTNPFSLRNMKKWLIEKGPKIAAILIGALILLWVVHHLDERIVNVIAHKTEHGSRVDRENRAKTLVGVFHNAASIVIIISAFLMVLDELQIPIAPLMGGVAVVGLAVAFGAQNLVRDFFSGFMILLENQYGINDVVRIGEVAGLVEKITLRITVLRDLEGIAHFIPNGQVDRVSNLTYRWSRVVLDIGVSYNEDPDRVMEVIKEEADKLYHDEHFGRLILEPPEMLGLDAFGDSAIVFKIIIKTRTLKQWDTKRAMLLRLKRRFDAEGIEIPYPHRTVYLRTDEPDLSALLRRLNPSDELPGQQLGGGDKT